MSESGESLNALYRVVDADGEVLWDGTYEDEDSALSRRAREMSEHPDGDDVTVVKYEPTRGAVVFTPDELESVERAIELDLRQSEAGDFQVDADLLRNALEKVNNAR